MKKTSFALTALALLTLCSCAKKKETRTETPEIEVAKVQVRPVLLHKSYPAYLTADDYVDIVARVDGYLTDDMGYGGKFVKKGTVLYRIQSNQYADAVNQAEATLRNAEAAYEYARNNYAAMQKALESDAVSQMEVLQAKSTLDRASGDIKNARAALASARTTLGYCTITAPFDGHLTTASYSTGAFLAGSASPVVIATLYKDGTLKANLAMDDKAFAAMNEKLSDPKFAEDLKHVPVVFDVPLGHSYTGYYSYAAPAIDRETGTLRVQVKMENPYGELRPGMYCKVNMPDQAVKDAMLVRDASIGTDQLGKYVYTVSDSDKVVYTHIKVGDLVNDTMRLVTEGLRPGDRYVTKALLKVRDGMTVRPVMAGSAAAPRNK